MLRVFLTSVSSANYLGKEEVQVMILMMIQTVNSFKRMSSNSVIINPWLLFFSFAPATKTAPVNPLRFQELRKKKVPCVSVNQLPLWESPLLNTALVFQQPQLNLVPVQKPASAAWTCTDQSRPFSTDADGHTPTRKISRAAIVTFHRMTE